jgi:hypothetical protein
MLDLYCIDMMPQGLSTATNTYCASLRFASRIVGTDLQRAAGVKVRYLLALITAIYRLSSTAANIIKPVIAGVDLKHAAGTPLLLQPPPCLAPGSDESCARGWAGHNIALRQSSPTVISRTGRRPGGAAMTRAVTRCLRCAAESAAVGAH